VQQTDATEVPGEQHYMWHEVQQLNPAHGGKEQYDHVLLVLRNGATLYTREAWFGHFGVFYIRKSWDPKVFTRKIETIDQIKYTAISEVVVNAPKQVLRK